MSYFTAVDMQLKGMDCGSEGEKGEGERSGNRKRKEKQRMNSGIAG